ncbi:MAG: carboxypeptidase regulatory-like domain-containing protein [Planctomycetota bacterium]|nr:carboxypeptidase regulatory-like domain-containing protein [Planctomycetota bacterium]
MGEREAEPNAGPLILRVEAGSTEGRGDLQVIWTGVDALDGLDAHHPIPHERWLDKAVHASAVGPSEFELPTTCRSQAGVVWVHSEGHGSAWKFIEAGTTGEVVELSGIDSRPLDVVVTLRGEPAEGAQVTQAVGVDVDSILDLDLEEQLALRLFRRTYLTDEEGRGRATDPGFTCSYEATKGSNVSYSVVQAGPEKVELELEGGIELVGRVLGWERPMGPATISLHYRYEDGFAEPFLTVPVSDEGVIGPRWIPTDPGDSYEYLFSGVGLERQVQVHDSPLLGSRLELLFEARRSASLAVEVTDTEGSPVPGVVLALTFLGSEHGWVGDYGQVTTDDLGAVLIDSLPASDFHIGAFHADFEDRWIGPFSSQALLAGPMVIELQRLATLVGRVEHLGRPVEEFSIFAWSDDPDEATDPVEFHDRVDGTFELPDLPQGRLSIYATAPGLAQSEPVTMELGGASGEEVVLKLQEPLDGWGRVVDEESGNPLSGVSVRVFSTSDWRAHAEQGEPAITDSDGRFRVSGFRPGAVTAAFDLEGYTHSMEYRVSKAGVGADFGVVRLARHAELHVDFIRVQGQDWDGFEVQLYGPVSHAPIPMPADGRYVYPAAARSISTMTVYAPDGSSYGFNFDLRGRGPWHEVCRLPTEEGFFVEIKDPRGLLRDGGSLKVRAAGPERRSSSASVALAAGQESVHVGFLGDGEHQFVVRDYGLKQLALATARPESSSTPVIITIGAGPSAHIKVVDQFGRGVSNLTVFARMADSPETNFGTFTTDPHGFVDLGELPGTTLLLDILSPDRGGMFGQRVLLADAEGGMEATVVWLRSASLSLEFRDGDEVLPGLEYNLLEPTGAIQVGFGKSDPSGRAAHEKLAPGRLILRPYGAGVWFEDTVVEVLEAPVTQVVQVRRTGSLLVRLLDAFGEPRQGSELTLGWEGGGDVQGWIDSGLIEGPGALATDSSGELRLAGVPRGSYSVTVEGTGVVGELLVPAGGVGELELKLQP